MATTPGGSASVDRPATTLAGNPHVNELSRRGPGLDLGERHAILLAEELTADQIDIDEIRGRREGQRRGLHFTGTLGVLAAAAEQRLVDLRKRSGPPASNELLHFG